MSEKILPFVLPATEASLPSATDRARRFPFSSVSSAVLLIATGLGLASCGGGSGAGNGASPAPVLLGGQAIKGPVSGGRVCAYTLSSPRQQVACAITDANANYQLQLPAGTDEVLLEVTGGSYTDEATGQKVALTTPLRTLSKAGSADNTLITPFTELAVQRATVGNPGGNISLVGFQTQIGQLEAGLGITGLATGQPFGGKSSADITHRKALEAFAKQQNSLGKTVDGTLQLIGSEIDKCGIAGVGVSLAVYGAVGSTVSESGGSLLLSAPTEALASTNLIIRSYALEIDMTLPAPCVDSLVVDGESLSLTALATTPVPSAWLSAKSVEITQCTGGLSGTINFPSANLKIHLSSINFPSATITSTGDYTLSGAAKAIDLPQSGISLNTANGCLLPATGNKSGFGALTIVNSTVGSGGGAVPIGSSPAGGSISIGGGGVVVTGGSNGSGGGGITVGSKSN